MTLILNKKNYIIYTLTGLAVWLIFFTLYNTYKRSNSPQYKIEKNMQEDINTKLNTGEYEKVIFAGGCFWCTESEFNHAEGVISALSGYADSEKENPSYEEVSSQSVKAREGVEVVYEPSKISFEKLLEKYWTHIDPTDAEGSFADRGHQYTSAIYYTTENQKVLSEKSKNKIEEIKKIKVATEILPFVNFYLAEEYHQDYKDKNPIRYNAYREGSGRNNYIRIHWQDNSTTTRAIFPSSYWINFTPEIKEEKIKTLTSIQYNVTQKEDTERPFENIYNNNKDVGIYVDIVSGEPLFLSKDKFDSGTGWPSFVRPINENYLTLKTDNYLLYSRTEVRSKIADSHLGHVFEDGPKDEGGKRYCMNSASMRFVNIIDMEKEGYGEYINLLK